MIVTTFPDSSRPKWPGVVAALGNFDGLHRGHQTLLDRVRRQAAEIGGSPVAVTFDPHPSRVLRPDKAPPLLMTLDQKLEAFDRAGMHGVVVVRFTPELSRFEPERFVDLVLVEWLQVAEVWVGANFLFGRDRAGTFTLLRALGEDRGFRAEKIDPVRYRDFVVSSTRIRHLIDEGRVDLAAALLGHHYVLDGTVVHGDGRGRTLGFPTANLETVNELLPALGVYATVATIDGVHHPSVSSVGTRPTVGGGPVTVETFLLEGAGDLYGRRVRLAFVQWLREEVHFAGLEPLRAQMADDVAKTRALFAQIVV
jgi:riboflavin kinase/FMN adenylyltransferase